MSSILIVHPDEKTTETLGSILAKRGHRASSACDGPRALAAFARLKPDIVIVNRLLPDTETFQVFAQLRRMDPKAKVLLFDLLEPAGAPGRAPFGVRGLRPAEALRVVEELRDGASQLGADGVAAPRVLVVDDDAVVRAALRRFLSDQGYQTADASSGEEALSLLKRARPHLVLLDVDMPEMSGVETLRRIRETDPAVGVMMVTGDDQPETMALCRELGAYDYLVKPFDLQYLEFSVYSKILLMTV
jgi:DNA-binding response OmpR family regulator